MLGAGYFVSSACSDSDRQYKGEPDNSKFLQQLSLNSGGASCNQRKGSGSPSTCVEQQLERV